jgi:hypothetical protein
VAGDTCVCEWQTTLLMGESSGGAAEVLDNGMFGGGTWQSGSAGMHNSGAFTAEWSDGVDNGRRRAVSTSGNCMSICGAVVSAGRHCSAICQRGRAGLEGFMSKSHTGSYIIG